MAHNKKYSVKQRIQMVWFNTETKPISFTPLKYVKPFDLNHKHDKPSKTNYPSCGWLTSF